MAKRIATERPTPSGDHGVDQAAIDGMSYEEAVEALDEIIQSIEAGDVGLEASIHAYERGTALIRRCKTLLSAAEQRVRELDDLDTESNAAPGAGAE